MKSERYVYINDRPVLWEDETNILALAQKHTSQFPPSATILSSASTALAECAWSKWRAWLGNLLFHCSF